MWNRNSKRRTRRPQQKQKRPAFFGGAAPARPTTAPRKRVEATALSIFWRKLRQRVRRYWRWSVVRAVRRLVDRWSGRPDGVESERAVGDVRQFPTSR